MRVHLSCGCFSINAVVTAGFPSEESVNPGWKTVFSHFHCGFDLHFVESIDEDGPTVDSKIISRFSTAWRSAPLISTLFNGQLSLKQKKIISRWKVSETGCNEEQRKGKCVR